jgi:radical SAM superfamily enzyme YgiQ (UPF0313 family)
VRAPDAGRLDEAPQEELPEAGGVITRQVELLVEVEEFDPRPVDAWFLLQGVEERKLRRAGGGDEPRAAPGGDRLPQQPGRMLRRGPAHGRRLVEHPNLHAHSARTPITTPKPESGIRGSSRAGFVEEGAPIIRVARIGLQVQLPEPGRASPSPPDPNDSYDLTLNVNSPSRTRRSSGASPRRGGSDPRAPRTDVLAREVGTIRKTHGGRLRVALAFPNSYFVGMSNLGLQTVYGLLNADERVVCERVFLPPKPDIERLLTRREPLVTLESGMPVRDFDVFALSVSFEWDYTNVVSLLRLAGLEPRAERRRWPDPLVVIGGAVTFVNPEPLAPFADVIAAGEAELLVPAIVDAIAQEGTRDREALLNTLVGTAGFYVPSLYDVTYDGPGRVAAITPKPGSAAPPTVRKAAVKASDKLDPPATRIFTPDTEFGSRLLIEVVRGCANLCRFCWAGYNYLPVRPFSTDRILEIAEAARPYANRVGLVSIALCDHPDIVMILERLLAMGYAISPASLRLDDLTEPIVRLLKESGERSITIAPETGSDRLRRVINKTVTNEQILDRTELIFRCGMENLKLYYMIGLPSETDEDLRAIVDLTLEMRDRMMAHARTRGSVGRLVASVNPLVPKPGTTYQWLPMTRSEVIDEKTERLRALVAGIDNVYFNIKSERHSFYQGLLSLGDRRVADVIERAERNGGNWRAAVAESGLDAEAYLYRDRTRDAFLPWQIIDGSLKTNFFRDELEKSTRAEWTLPSKRVRLVAEGASPIVTQP